jgi:hypothetical protein
VSRGGVAVPMRQKVIWSGAGVGSVHAVPLTHNAQQVMEDVERHIRDQGGRFQ